MMGHVTTRSPSPTTRALAPLTAVAAVVVVAAVIAVPVALHRGGAGPAAPGAVAQADVEEPPVPRPAMQGRGVPVEGAGTLLREGRVTKLCAQVVVTLSLPPSTAACGAVWVPVTGVAAHWLRHSTTEGQKFSDQVRVEGAYANGRLAVNRVRRAGPPDATPLVQAEVPCGAPAGGWRPGRGFDSSAEEAAAAERLQRAVGAGRDRFTEPWEGHPVGAATEGESTPAAVMVVGTTGDPAAARVELAKVYGGNICVHRVRYAAAELDRTAQQLREASDGRIDAQPSIIENRVRVRVVALDPATVSLLDKVGRDAMLLEEPMLQWLD
jgi:hypothetical protein